VNVSKALRLTWYGVTNVMADIGSEFDDKLCRALDNAISEQWNHILTQAMFPEFRKLGDRIVQKLLSDITASAPPGLPIPGTFLQTEAARGLKQISLTATNHFLRKAQLSVFSYIKDCIHQQLAAIYRQIPKEKQNHTLRQQHVRTSTAMGEIYLMITYQAAFRSEIQKCKDGLFEACVEVIAENLQLMKPTIALFMANAFGDIVMSKVRSQST
jgi:hypothetical protein